jgi:predicted ribosome quality control (RQC) complex YloA/Tae2 family protein
VEIELQLDKTIEENATIYFEKSKKAKKKILGLEKAIIAQKQRQEKKSNEIIQKTQKKVRKKKWFEKYRWFITSNGLIVVGGKTAQQNEEIVKKQMKKEDVYFHAEIHGAPHCIIKTKDEKTKKIRAVPETSMKEAAQFAGTFSKAFGTGQSMVDVYSVKPEQVSKKAPSGESMGTGAFMIYGERNWFKKSSVSCAIGYNQKYDSLMCGPISAVKQKCVRVFELKQGNQEKNSVAKELQKKFKEKGYSFTNSEILSLLPNGTFEIN